MTDHNRNGEPLCDWSDLPIAGCAHCHGRHHEHPEPLGTRPRPATPGTIVNLDEYQRHPYYRTANPADLPQPAHGDPCECGRPTGDAYLCPLCADQLDVILGDIPALVEDLEIQQQGRATNRTYPAARAARDPESLLYTTPGAALDDSTLEELIARQIAILGRGRPDHAAATRTLGDLHNRLMHAVLRIAGTVPTVDTHDCSSVGLSRWLLGQRIHLHPAAPAVLDDLAPLHHQALHLIDNQPERIWWGYCVGTIEDQPCDREVSTPRSAHVWQCPDCGTEYNLDTLEQLRIDRARDALLTIDELAALTSRNPNTVRQMLHRRGITPIGRTPDGIHLYRGADYLDTLQQGA